MLVIGFAGGTGSGKTTVVNNVLHELNSDEIVVISQDNYYKNHPELSYEERMTINFDHPRSIDFDLLISDIKKLRNNESIQQPIYSFANHARTDDTILTQPKKVVIIEGILVLTESELRKELDLKIFIHADSDERLIRRIRRDTKERGRDLDEVLNRYQTTLKPMHEQFIESSKNYADLIIPNMNRNPAAVKMLSMMIQNRMQTENRKPI